MAASILVTVIISTAALTVVNSQSMPMMPLPQTDLLPISLPPPPKLEGALAPNSVLAKVIKLSLGRLRGPESMAIHDNFMYTGLNTPVVLEMDVGPSPPNGNRFRRYWPLTLNTTCFTAFRNEDTCGRPLGIRIDNERNLVGLDASRGIFKIRFWKGGKLEQPGGKLEWLMDANDVNLQGIKLRFLNDLTMTKGGVIFFTSSSVKYSRSNFMDVILTGDKSGRVLVFNPFAKPKEQVSELAKNLHFPNGLQLSQDETFLLVAEGAQAKIHKIWLATSKRGLIETFAENLPGFIDNIRLSPRGTFWVAVSSVRYHGKPGVLDQYGLKPNYRQLILLMPKDQLMKRAPKYGMVLELNQQGQIIRSLHDPHGVNYGAISEVDEYNGNLYLGSFKASFVGKIPMVNLPPVVTPPPTTPGSPSNKDTTVNASGYSNNNNVNTNINRINSSNMTSSGNSSGSTRVNNNSNGDNRSNGSNNNNNNNITTTTTAA
ncbi:hypothetical protein ACOMHN_034827 [Nucella lapillus]